MNPNKKIKITYTKNSPCPWEPTVHSVLPASSPSPFQKKKKLKASVNKAAILNISNLLGSNSQKVITEEKSVLIFFLQSCNQSTNGKKALIFTGTQFLKPCVHCHHLKCKLHVC